MLPDNLRCEYRTDPLGIDVVHPRLSWVLTSDQRGQRQSAYQILVASSIEKLDSDACDLWNSGKVESGQSTQVTYAGATLRSGLRCWWKVRAWDKDGSPSAWSEPALWSMGLLAESDWNAQWIGTADAPKDDAPKDNAIKDDTLKDDASTASSTPPDERRRLPARMLRRDFDMAGRLKQATAFVCGLGYYELHINGRKMGENVLDPGLTDYAKRALYVTYDITDHLRQGANAVGVILGNGRFFAPRVEVPIKTKSYGLPRLLLKIRVELDDGTTFDLGSDDTWSLTTNGPIRTNNDYDGEAYDATMEQQGWSEPGFDDSGWEKARLVDAPGGRLVAQIAEPIRVTETIKPVTLTTPQPGVHVFDMGRNMVGWCRLTVTGPRGTRVSLRHAETLKDDGTPYMTNLRSCEATDTYILKGDAEETWEPRFTYHGFRYVELSGFPGEPTLATIAGRVVHSSVKPAGSFQCSDKMLNRIHENILWGVKGNLRSIPTDCPQRDERHGWLGDIAVQAKAEMYDFNVAQFFSKWLNDIDDAQDEKGGIPDVAPPYWDINTTNVTWPSAYCIIPRWLHEHYADTRAIESHYDSMCAWLDFLAGFRQDGIIPIDQYGDWCVPPESPDLIHSEDPSRKTDGKLLATAYFYHLLRLVAQFAKILGKPADAERLGKLADDTRLAFNAKFFNEEKNLYDNGTQTSSVLPLAFGMVPEAHEQAVFDNLVRNILVKHDAHIATGLVGGQWLMRVLSDFGRADVAYRLASQTTYPSWGYMVEHNATTIWELWNGNTADPAMNSHNHLMLVGDLGVWFYEYLAGIRPDPAQPGFKHFFLRPHLVPNMTFAKATHESLHGAIVSDWRIEGDVFHWDIVVPANTTATAHMPAVSCESVTESGQSLQVTESGKSIEEAEGVAIRAQDDNALSLELAPGTYTFATPITEPLPLDQTR